MGEGVGGGGGGWPARAMEEEDAGGREPACCLGVERTRCNFFFFFQALNRVPVQS